jgi:GH15 family glucan-1,4-alpha-glucosidase
MMPLVSRPSPARLVLACALALGSAPAAAQALVPHASWPILSWSNGHGAAAYDTTRARLTTFREHLFARTTAAPTRELAYDAYPGLRVGGQNLWLTNRPVTDAGYDAGRGIARVVQNWNGVEVTSWMWSPFDVPGAVTITMYEVRNTTAAALTDAALFTIENLHVGSGDGTIGERITWNGGAFEERGAAGLVVHAAYPAPTFHGASPQNPYALVTAGGHLVDIADSGVMNDAVAGFEWDLSGLAAGATARFALVLAHRGDGDRAALTAALAGLPPDSAAMLTAARAEWDAFFAGTQAPMGLAPDEAAVYRQQLAVLRMGQVADGPGSGQIIASLPPGMWDIAWVRDQSYATLAMIRAGMRAQARAALAFTFAASAGQWVCCDRDGGPWVGAPYAVSTVRYTGDGVEESDQNAQGPNIEFDGFGLALLATDAYVAATGDLDLVRRYDAAIFARTADVLVGLLETSGATAGLLRADSSIWETHWYDGGKKHFAFTQATACRGLRAAADLADRLTRPADAARYRAAADSLAAAFAAHFLDGAGALKGNLEEASALDAASIEALNWDVVPATGRTASATLDAFRAGLWNEQVGHGYRRNDDGGPYDLREWIMIDLRIAAAARRAGRADDAAALIAWVTAQARLNFDLLPENYDRLTGDYQGEVPMVGFGAGAYVMTLWDRGGVGPIDGDGAVGGDTAVSTQPGGCCDGGRADGGLLLAGLVAWVARRRRA